MNVHAQPLPFRSSYSRLRDVPRRGANHPERGHNLLRRCDMSDLTLSPKDIQRFWSRVDKSGGPDACWPWTRGCFSFGYGQIRIQSKARVAHRLAWELTHGPIPNSLFVLHHCDNPPCCNPGPKHLFLGTQKDNIRDAASKGRMASGDRHGKRLHPELCPRGEQHGNAKLTVAQILQIRALSALGTEQIPLGKKSGVAQVTIWNILHRRTWKHVA